MTLRGIAREFKDFPATMVFCTLWIVVFAAMLRTRFAGGDPTPWKMWLLVGIGEGHRFGDLALSDIGRGEIWRLVTSTFVHYSVLHIALNLLAMYQLGTLVESWYGSHQFVLIYALTGGVGNLISVMIRRCNGSGLAVHSGGGSVVIMGLVGLCAVAGWRSRSELGVMLGRQMVFFMFVTALLGVAFPKYIDNWGHLGGALVGAVLGLAHRVFIRRVFRPSAWGPGVLAGIVIVICGVAQVCDDRWEAPIRQKEVVLHLATLVRALQHHPRLGGQLVKPEALLRGLDALKIESVLDNETRADLIALRRLARGGLGHDDMPADIYLDFEVRLTRMFKQVHRRYVIELSKLNVNTLWEIMQPRGSM
jgi:membrane associated rhomboid family serine protease